MSIFKMKFYFRIFPSLYIYIIIEQLTDKLHFFFQKTENCTGLLSTLMKLVKPKKFNQMNSGKIMDGSVGFAVKLLIHFIKYLDRKIENLKECHCSYQYYYKTWNSQLDVCLLTIVVLLSNHENRLQTIFLPKNSAYLVSYFLSQHFVYLPFCSHCKEYCV